MTATAMPELLLTWLTHSTLALAAAALCGGLRLPTAVCDAVWRAAVVMPFVTSALLVLGIEPAGPPITIASPLEVATQAAPAVLVAQVGPSGTFNSKALMGKGEARVTATAAVHSEAFVLTRYPRP